jgi:DNA polymerase III epsilon subunit-like protein
MINYNKICVFDFETDGSDPSVCSPVQLAAVMVDPIKLDIIPNSDFNVTFKPEVIEKDPEYEYTTDVVDFHAKVSGCSKADIMERWRNNPAQEHSWKMFVDYLDKYHSRSSRKSQFSAPIAAGYNIYRFDLPIMDRMAVKYGNTNKEGRNGIFFPRDVIDIINLMFYWFEQNGELKSYSLDSVRDYFGISKEGAHDAIKDIKDSAEIMIRFMKLHRRLANNIKFKDSFKE